MAGRLPKPTALLEAQGAFRKNPARRRARQGEPQPPAGGIGAPPERWQIFHPELGYQKFEKLRAIWDNCAKMWPWLTPSDRDAVEQYAKLKYKDDQHLYASGPELSGAELTAILRLRTELGGTGSGRARLGVRAAGLPREPAKKADPRIVYMKRRAG
jgi:hypothetical protein